MDEAQVSRVGIVGKAFNVEREAAIDGVGGEEAENLITQRGGLACILEDVAEVVIPALGVGVVVVQVREDLGVFLCRLDDTLDPVSVVGVVNRGAFNHGILADVVAAHHHQGSRGRVGVEPLREEQIDLVDVFLEGGVAGGIVLDIIGGAQTFAGVEGNLRGLAGGVAARGPLAFGAMEHGRAVGPLPAFALRVGKYLSIGHGRYGPFYVAKRRWNSLR